ncbi:MAG: pilus assembly protein [Hyphomonas sp.]
MFARFVHCQSGNIVVPAALASVVMIAAGGGAVDMMSVTSQKSALKSLADNAALSAVREMTIVSDDPERIAAVAIAYVESSRDGANVSVQPKVDMKERTVTVALTSEPRTYFPGPFSNMKAISESSTAKLAGTGGNVCMIGLSPTAISTLRMRSKAQITAETCALYSNSTSVSSMSVSTTAQVSADFICVAGGYQGKESKNTKRVVEDCPQIEDPLASRPVPEIGACDFRNTKVKKKAILDPGVYCGGLTVDGGTAELQPGVYIIKGGRFLVTNGGTLRGEDVGFYLADDYSKIGFDYEANVDIAAPRDGIMAGLLIMSAPYTDLIAVGGLNKLKPVDDVNTTLRIGDGILPADHTIRSDNARRLVGTIYLPNGKLLIDGRNPIADRSEYTVIVADTFELRDGPNLVLRTDYKLSKVPVPEGVGPSEDVSSVLVN